MNYKENLKKALAGEKVDVKPVVSVTQLGIVDAMGKTNTSWPEAHKDPQQMATLAASLHELIGLDRLTDPLFENGII